MLLMGMNVAITSSEGKAKGTRVTWLSRTGRFMEHNFGWKATVFYSADWWRRSILECQGVLTVDERRNSNLRLLEIRDVAEAV